MQFHNLNYFPGPFQWPVWVALTVTYLVAIFPLAYSDRLSLRYLIEDPGQIENMFWYVFGTFTNSLTFAGELSWSKSKKTSTRLLIGIIMSGVKNFNYMIFSYFRMVLGIYNYYHCMLYRINYCFCDTSCFPRDS